MCRPRSADFCIVLVRFLIPSCSKWPASFFDTEPNAPTTTIIIIIIIIIIIYFLIIIIFFYSERIRSDSIS